jgi:glycine oxidase
MSLQRVIVVGGGAVGLSVAWELAERKLRVVLLERGAIGREASWAGAGILTPGDPDRAEGPHARLMALSLALHRRWAERLRGLTGIDNGFRACGGAVVGDSAAEERLLAAVEPHWRNEGVEFRRLSREQVRRLEPALNPDLRVVYHLPGTGQLRNPRHLKALTAACAAAGVEVRADCPVEGLTTDGRAVTGVRTAAGPVPADAVVVAAGPWSQQLLAPLGVAVRTRPVRGQIVLLSTARPLLAGVVERGPCYLVPRDDGRLLVGSTEEDAGFEKANTPEAIAELTALAAHLVPATADATFEQAWSGLRPGNADGRPYIGAVGSHPGLYVAAGHFRNGIQMSTGTAVMIADLITGRTPPVDPTEFDPARHGATAECA